LSRQSALVRLSALGQSIIYGVFFAAALIAIEPTARSATPPVSVGGPFTLTAADGATVTDQTYRGKWLIVYFGYTSCPDSCPTTLIEIGRAVAVLGADAIKLQPLFITVDPKRDTRDVMEKYIQSFDPRIVALTGSSQQIASVAHAYGAYAAPRKTGPGPSDYVVDHSSYLYVMDPEGTFVRGFDADAPGDSIGGALRLLMGQSREERDLTGQAAK
jgi:protein SCO1/2